MVSAGMRRASPTRPRFSRRSITSNLIGASFGPPPHDVPRSAIGWPIVPSAFRDTLLDLHARFRLPIYVMENGTADNDKIDAVGRIQDDSRIAYLKAYTEAMQQAMADGADVRGYFVWSLLDNFEWDAGYSQRFGIVYVDYATQRRIPKASARWYSDMIAMQRNSVSSAARGNRVESG
jgi:beta-glucosidase